MPIRELGVELGWEPAKLSGTWEPDSAERAAAWELYVELVTRISVVPLTPRPRHPPRDAHLALPAVRCAAGDPAQVRARHCAGPEEGRPVPIRANPSR